MNTISALGLGKRYFLGHDGRPRAPAGSLREALARWRPGTRAPDAGNEFWALRDVNLDIKHGQVVGVIGRNGAGKSTLMKTISRITRPTEGEVKLRGRVASLLEVGTGFHPELTGRENIFLNGSILGMSRGEILGRFDEIVAFAEIEQFIDTPVKRYSSGMYVRLAFAVAAHLEPEILLVDEVLAVGDAEFQQKCLGKMEGVASSGRTILFVSHQMSAVRRLCNRVVLLDAGSVADDGDRDRVIGQYLSRGPQRDALGQWIGLGDAKHSGGGGARFLAVRYHGASVDAAPVTDGPLNVDLAIESDRGRTIASLSVVIYDRYGTKLVNCDTLGTGEILRLEPGRNEVRMKIRSIHLKPGEYVLGLWLAEQRGHGLDNLLEAARLQISDPPIEHRYGQTVDLDGYVSSRFTLEPL